MCLSNNCDMSDEKSVVSFLCVVADASDRPRSALNCASAALSHWFIAGNYTVNPLNHYYVRNMITALVKSGTSDTRHRSRVIPIAPIKALFHSWPCDTELSIKQLRQKCLTLLALSLMLRPSDIAPKSVSFDPESGATKCFNFSRDQVTINTNGTVTIVFHGIKNDTDRASFSIDLQPATDVNMCPVWALKEYLCRTDSLSLSPHRPVFLNLKRPYSALTAQSIAACLNDTLKVINLYPKYTAKDFRPTGATIQVKKGVHPKTVRKVGRWKTDTVFFDHYVHSKTPEDFTDNVISGND